MDTNECPSISSSDSESDVEGDSVIQSACSGTELTLQDDDESPLLMQQCPDDEDEEEDEQVILYEDEGEGEGAEEPVAEPVKEFPMKTGGDKKKKKRKRKKLYICLTNCKYDVVRRTSRKFGFKEVSEDDEWTLYWTDFSVALERVMEMRNYQKINHFPGMSELCRKDLLARNLNRMVKVFPKEYNIFPKTWCLPADYGDFQAYTRQKKSKTYILKPESGCQGRGIWITRSPKDIKPHEHMICQVYTSRPYLIDGFKFDLRVYTLVTSCDPLRIFVFKDGLARFATSKYCEPTHNNTDNVYMHLTNYAINKNSEDFVRDDEAGSKRRITTINRYLQGKGIDVEKIWADIDDAIIKTLISAHSTLKHNYRSCFPNHVKGSACFEILGFDILLDRRLRPHVIEVNHSPSFTTDAAIDREIKGALIWDTLNLVNFAAADRKRCLEEERRRIKDRLMGKTIKKETKEELEVAQQQYLEHLEKYENSHMGNFRRIFPAPGSEKYNKYFHTSGTLFQETASFRARSELARQQREEISRKKEKMEMMQKVKKRVEGLRPESPLGRRRPVHNNIAKLNPRTSCPPSQIESSKPVGEKTVDTRLPVDILEEEELERISGLLQRDNLVRGLGIVEHVYRLLHCTPGTVGVLQAEPKPQPLSLGRLNIWPRVPGMQSDSCLFTSGQRNMSPIHIKAKDRSYYKKLLDRYFGMDHALAKLGDSDKGSSYEEHQQTVEKAAGISNSSFCSPKCLYQAFPQVRLTHSKQRNGAAHLNASNSSHTNVTDISNEEASSDTSGEENDTACSLVPVVTDTLDSQPSINCPPSTSQHPAPSLTCLHAIHETFAPTSASAFNPSYSAFPASSSAQNHSHSDAAASLHWTTSPPASGGWEHVKSRLPSAGRSSTTNICYLPSPIIGPFTMPASAHTTHGQSASTNTSSKPVCRDFFHSTRSSPTTPKSVNLPSGTVLLPFPNTIPFSAASPYSIVLSTTLMVPRQTQSSTCVYVSTPQPGPTGQRWQVKSQSLNSIHDRIPQAHLRNKLGRKGAPGAGGRMGIVVQESDIRSIPGMFDTETEKSRILARSGHPPSHHSFNSHSSIGGCVSEWGRSDTSTPARVRGLSATRYRESDLGTRFVLHPPSLSVVSAPAPVFQRPDIGSPHTGWPNHHPFRVSSPTNAVLSHRSTRSQRVRGVTNSVRLRELQMRENQAYVLS